MPESTVAADVGPVVNEKCFFDEFTYFTNIYEWVKEFSQGSPDII